VERSFCDGVAGFGNKKSLSCLLHISRGYKIGFTEGDRELKSISILDFDPDFGEREKRGRLMPAILILSIIIPFLFVSFLFLLDGKHFYEVPSK
jgi:hypothetical protein